MNESFISLLFVKKEMLSFAESVKYFLLDSGHDP